MKALIFFNTCWNTKQFSIIKVHVSVWHVEGSFWIIKSLWIVYNFDMGNLQYCFIHVLVLILLYWSLTGGQALGLGSTLYRSDLWTLHSDWADRGKWHRGPSPTLNTCPSPIVWHPLSPLSLFIEQGQISDVVSVILLYEMEWTFYHV